jgi:hypothetical protein
MELWHKAKLKAKGASKVIDTFQNLAENITLFGASRRVGVEIEEDIKPMFLILMPESRFKMFWNVVTLILLMYTASFVPYQTSFID